MANKIFPIPIQGINKGMSVSDVPPSYSSDMNNVRPWDALEGMLRLGQRPAFKKMYSQQIGGSVGAGVIAMCQVSTVT